MPRRVTCSTVTRRTRTPHHIVAYRSSITPSSGGSWQLWRLVACECMCRSTRRRVGVPPFCGCIGTTS